MFRILSLLFVLCLFSVDVLACGESGGRMSRRAMRRSSGSYGMSGMSAMSYSMTHSVQMQRGPAMMMVPVPLPRAVPKAREAIEAETPQPAPHFISISRNNLLD